MKKKQPARENTYVRGVSFPIKPFNLYEWAQQQAEKDNRNFNNFIVDLLFQEKARREGKK